MANNSLNKDEIKNLLPHREPMLLIDELINIVPNKSGIGVINVNKDSQNSKSQSAELWNPKRSQLKKIINNFQ